MMKKNNLPFLVGFMYKIEHLNQSARNLNSFTLNTYVSITDTIRRRRFFPIQCEVGLNASILFAVEIAAIQ